MSVVAGPTDLRISPMAIDESYGGLSPSAIGHRDLTAAGDATGGTVSATLSLPFPYFWRLESLHAYTDDAAADVGGVRLRSNFLWFSQATPSASAFALSYADSVANAATRSGADPRQVASFVEMVRRVPNGVLSGAALASVDVLWATNVNGTSYTIEATFSGWLKPAFGLGGFLEAFHQR